MKRWQDWAVEHTEKGARNPRANLLTVILRFRIEHDNGCAEAERDGVPFTPIWWWWNRDADEYVMTLWDTEAGKDELPAGHLIGKSDPAAMFGRPNLLRHEQLHKQFLFLRNNKL
jgi:hypothetical protein